MRNKVVSGQLSIVNCQKGFTLVELLIYMGILAILIVVMTDIITAIFSTGLSSRSNSAVIQDGRYIYSKLTYDINTAQSVSEPANLGDASNTLTLLKDGTTYTYSLSSDKLQISDGVESDDLNGPDTAVSALQFKRIGNANGKHTFQINYTITGTIPLKGGVESQVYQTTAGLR